MREKKSHYESLQENVRKLKLPKIEVWENKYSDKSYVVHLETNEFTSICPKTKLPDFATVYLDYKPRKFCVELKSFKLYLSAFRNIGIFHEHVANRILDDFTRASAPGWARVRLEFNLRGGIKTTVLREYKRAQKFINGGPYMPTPYYPDRLDLTQIFHAFARKNLPERPID